MPGPGRTSTPAAPVTARTRPAVAAARAGRSHHGQCATSGPWSGMRRRSTARRALDRRDRQRGRLGQAYAEQRESTLSTASQWVSQVSVGGGGAERMRLTRPAQPPG